MTQPSASNRSASHNVESISMWRAITCGCLVLLAGCAVRSEATRLSLQFLTADGCPYSATMRANLDTALSALRLPTDYRVIDVHALTADDPRSGYGTPTILVGDRDLFGTSASPSPHPPAG